MRKNNPAVYRCPKSEQGMHYWVRNKDRTARCIKCKLVLNKEDADDCFQET